MSSTNCSCSLAGSRYCEICESNPNKRAIKITSRRFSEFASNTVVDGVKYNVQTEKMGKEKPIIITTVVKDGEIVSSTKADYSHLIGDAGLSEKLHELMSQEHSAAISRLKEEKPREGKMASIYIEEVRSLLRADDREGALKILDAALTEHPFNAFLLSYYGYLDAVVNKNCAKGVDLCKTAMDILHEELKEEVFLGQEVFYAVFCLNLGRAYLAGGARKNAVEVFKKGLVADPEDPDLLREVRRLGMRRKPFIPFLKRSNPINKYAGILSHNRHISHSAKQVLL
jgi:tetratricopeptide (TPR) repeat protein